MNEFVESVELQDDKIVIALRKAADAYENGEISEVKQTLWKIIKAISCFEQAY